MSTLQLIPLGVGDAFSERNYSNALALISEGRLLLVDCPHPIRKMMKEAAVRSRVDLSSLHWEGVILTHLHADHASGLESFAYFHHPPPGESWTAPGAPRTLPSDRCCAAT